VGIKADPEHPSAF